MKRLTWTSIALAVLAASLWADSASKGGDRALVVNAKAGGGTNAETVSVPRGSTTYKLTVKDEDFFSDDVLFESDWQATEGETSLNIQFEWICFEGEVIGGAGSSGEACAEIVFCVEFNNSGGQKVVEAGSACCPGAQPC